MDITTRLGQDRHGWMEDDNLRTEPAVVLVDVTAPEAPASERLNATHLVVVLDRSASMSGERLDHAKMALQEVVTGMRPDDSFGLVLFDDQVDVAVPAGPVGDRATALAAIDAVQPGGSTDLAAGLSAGLRQAARLDRREGVRVLLVSDGHANRGVVDHAVLARHAARFLREDGVSTSTLGMGLGYDEELLGAVSQAGGGAEYFANEADTAASRIRQECGDLVAERHLRCRLVVETGTTMRHVEVVNHVTLHEAAHGVEIELGGLRPDDVRSLVMRFEPTLATRPGRRKVARIHLTWVSADDLETYSVSTSVWAHVSRPGESPAVVDREVMAELLFQRVQRRKRRVAAKLAKGDVLGAARSLRRLVRLIKRELPSVPLQRRPEMEGELADALRQLEVTELGSMEDRAFASKAMFAATAVGSRRRDRRI